MFWKTEEKDVKLFRVVILNPMGFGADIDVMSVVERQLEPKQLWIGQLRSLLNHLNEVCTINETLKKKL